MDIAHELGQIHFAKDAPIDGLSLIKLIQSDRKVQLNGQDKIKITYTMPELKDKVSRVHQVLDQLRVQPHDWAHQVIAGLPRTDKLFKGLRVALPTHLTTYLIAPFMRKILCPNC